MQPTLNQQIAFGFNLTAAIPFDLSPDPHCARKKNKKNKLVGQAKNFRCAAWNRVIAFPAAQLLPKTDGKINTGTALEKNL